MYAKNYDGYKNLLKIHTKMQEKEQIASLDKKFFDNILVIMDASDLANYETIKPFFKDEDFFLAYENDREKKNAYLKTDRLVYAPYLKCFKDEDSDSLDLLKAIDKNISLDEVDKTNYQYQSLESFMQVDANNLALANLCNVEKRLNGKVTNEYLKRLSYELEVINKMGFVDYFLIVYDYVKYAKTNNILVGMGRGSAAGSLVSYTLGITDVDPLKYHLLFERFLNPERVTMPDIDIDFEDTKRNFKM